MKNNWVWRKWFERYLTILIVSIDIIVVLFLQLVSLFERLDSNFQSFFTEYWKILNNTLIRWCAYLFLITLEYAKRLVTYFQLKEQCKRIVWINNWALQIHCNPRVPLGTNMLVSEDWTKRDDRQLQRIYGNWYSLCILGKTFAKPFEIKELSFPSSCFS